METSVLANSFLPNEYKKHSYNLLKGHDFVNYLYLFKMISHSKKKFDRAWCKT